MKFRWSNGASYATEFYANSAETFIESGLAALAEFRSATHRKVHRGELGTDELWFDTPQLHTWLDDRWLNMGLIRRIAGELVMSFFENIALCLPITAPDLETVARLDEDYLRDNIDVIWQSAQDTYQYNLSLTVLIESVADQVRVNAAAAEMGRKTSKAKAEAARRNGRKGGRPKKKK